MSFSLGRRVAVTDAILTSNVPDAMPAPYNAGTSYAAGAACAVITGTVGEVYESRVNANLGNAPGSSPAQWRHIATVYAPWTTGTAYAAGPMVSKGGRIWKSLAGANAGNDPEASPTLWQDRGPTNRMAMFDNKTGTVSSRYGPLTVTLTPAGRVDTIGLFNVSAASATIVMTIDGDEVFNQTFSLVSTDGIVDWYTWLFEPIERKRDLVVSGLPNYANPTITITLDGDEVVSCGQCEVAYMRFIGFAQWDSQNGITDYSTKEKDDQGNWFIVERAFSKSGTLTIEVPRTDHDAVSDLLAQYRATPTMYVGSSLFRSHAFFGIPTDWKMRSRDTKTSLLSFSYEAI